VEENPLSFGVHLRTGAIVWECRQKFWLLVVKPK